MLCRNALRSVLIPKSRLVIYSCFSTSVSRDRFKVVFMGRDEFSCAIFKAVYDAHDIWSEIHIATNADAKSKHKLVASPLRLLGEQLGVPVATLSHSRDCWSTYSLPESIQPSDATALLLTASFGKIIPTRVLDAFPALQKLNVHGSLVPELRGPAPLQWAIARGHTETGASIIELSPRRRGIDRGVVLGAEKIDIAANETHRSLRERLAEVGGPLLVRVLRQLLAGGVTPTAQDDALASHAPAICAEDAQIDWATWDASRVERTHRAIGHQKHLTCSLPFGINGALKLRDVHMLPPTYRHPHLRLAGDCTYDSALGLLRVRCADGQEIGITRLQTVNKNVTTARDWWNGVPRDVQRDGRILQLGAHSSHVAENSVTGTH